MPSLSFNEVSRYARTTRSSPFSLRQLVEKRWYKEEEHLSVRPCHFSIMIYNMGLLPWPKYSASHDRSKAKSELVKQIRYSERHFKEPPQPEVAKGAKGLRPANRKAAMAQRKRKEIFFHFVRRIWDEIFSTPY